MRRWWFVAVLIFPVAGTVWAALGDGADKIEESYGGVVRRHLRDNGAVDVVYQKDRYFVQVTFSRGISVVEEYSRVDRGNLSEKEIARFLKMNSGPKMKWSRGDATAPGQGSTRFERNDHGAEGIATGAALKVRIKK